MRKTIRVQDLRLKVNAYLLNSRDEQKGNRQGMMTLLEGVLMDTGNYHGFGYLDADDMKTSDFGKTVGINLSPDGISAELTYEEKFEDTDNTRVIYF